MLLHLRTGITIATTWHVPTRDPYSFTAHLHPWVVESWLAELTYGLAYRVGGMHLVVLEQGILMAALALVIAALGRVDGTARMIVAAGVPVFAGIALWSQRPLLFGLLGLALLVLVVTRRWSPWWLLPIGWVWVNTHGSFPLGGLWLAAAYAGSALDTRARPALAGAVHRCLRRLGGPRRPQPDRPPSRRVPAIRGIEAPDIPDHRGVEVTRLPDRRPALRVGLHRRRAGRRLPGPHAVRARPAVRGVPCPRADLQPEPGPGVCAVGAAAGLRPAADSAAATVAMTGGATRLTTRRRALADAGSAALGRDPLLRVMAAVLAVVTVVFAVGVVSELRSVSEGLPDGGGNLHDRARSRPRSPDRHPGLRRRLSEPHRGAAAAVASSSTTGTTCTRSRWPRITEPYLVAGAGAPAVLRKWDIDEIVWQASAGLPALLRLTGGWRQVFAAGGFDVLVRDQSVQPAPAAAS